MALKSINHSKPCPRRCEGFALVLALSSMAFVLILVLSIFSLAAVETTNAAATLDRLEARENARLGLLQAIGTLQRELGEDRRVTAQADLLDPASARSAMVGVWESARAAQLDNPRARAPRYAAEKQRAFQRWLVSGPEDALLQANDFINAPVQPGGERALFTEAADGFDLRAQFVPYADDRGGFAWAVSDEGLKARLNLGEDAGARPTPDTIASPAGPGIGIDNGSGPTLAQPSEGWAQRRERVRSLGDLSLDPAYAYSGDAPEQLSADWTTVSRSVLADVARGGLKTDLTAAFEMDDSDFSARLWGDSPNPFRNGPAPGGEQPLFTPINSARPPVVRVDYDGRADETRTFTTGAVPTFDHLRDHYRKYLEVTNPDDPFSVTKNKSPYWSGSEPTQGGVAPVLNRILLFFSPWVDPNDPSVLRMVICPLIVLWNPYDQPIEAPAFFAHPRLDFPLGFEIELYRKNEEGDHILEYEYGRSYMGGHLGRGLPNSPGSGRSLDPYFLLQITRTGSDSTRRPIVIGAGEVRLFGPATSIPVPYDRTGSDALRTLRMKPFESVADYNNFRGGFAVRLDRGISTQSKANWTMPIEPTDEIRISANFAGNRFHYMMTLENEGRLDRRAEIAILSEVMVYRAKDGESTNNFVDVDEDKDQIVTSPRLTASALESPRPVAVLETFNRTAGEVGNLSNLLLTTNPRQRFVNTLLSGADFTSGPHYQTDFRAVADFLGSGLQVTPDAQRTYYGASNESIRGRDRLPFFSLPTEPLLNLAALRNADLVDTAFAPAQAFGNAWASPYLDTDEVAREVRSSSTGESFSPNLAIYDHAFLLNHALWDGFFFSSLDAGVARSGNSELGDWLDDPREAPLRNPRLRPWLGAFDTAQTEARLTAADRPLKVAAHLLQEGGFNVNSTSVEAWTAALASLRGRQLNTRSPDGQPETHAPSGSTFHRLTQPVGEANDSWVGFRELSDPEIQSLARAIVDEVRERGPFQSMGEFVARQLGRGQATTRKGALQAAIDRAGLNNAHRIERFDTAPYPHGDNLPDPYTGVGLPGWLTQADVLHSLGNSLTVRSDTFIVRSIGESTNPLGEATIRVGFEAVVQRVPDWTDPSDPPEKTPVTALSEINQAFGRRFVVVALREIDL